MVIVDVEGDGRDCTKAAMVKQSGCLSFPRGSVVMTCGGSFGW